MMYRLGHKDYSICDPEWGGMVTNNKMGEDGSVEKFFVPPNIFLNIVHHAPSHMINDCSPTSIRHELSGSNGRNTKLAT